MRHQAQAMLAHQNVNRFRIKKHQEGLEKAKTLLAVAIHNDGGRRVGAMVRDGEVGMVYQLYDRSRIVVTDTDARVF